MNINDRVNHIWFFLSLVAVICHSDCRNESLGKMPAISGGMFPPRLTDAMTHSTD